MLVDLGKVEAILPPQEQVPGEDYVHGARIKCYVVGVKKGHPRAVGDAVAHPPQPGASAVRPRGPGDRRRHRARSPAIAREAGHRTKIAVRSTRPGVNAKGACIGPMGARVRNVMNELHGEKIDIVDWSDDPAELVAHALSPARVSRVEVVDVDGRAARVIVPDYQLSLAIGKEGQNARLAARLTGWRIDIRPDTEPAASRRAGRPPSPGADAPAASG